MKYDTSNGFYLELNQSEINKIEYIHGYEPVENIQDAYSRTGCHIIINANFFGLSNGVTIGEVVDEGKVLSTNSLSPYGFAFKDKLTPIFSYKNDIGAVDFVGGYPCLIKNNQIYIDTNEFGFSATSTQKRGRTAIGIKSDGTFVIRCISDIDAKNTVTISELAQFMKNSGCVNACNLDGGGSSSWITPWSQYITPRKLDGFICIWLKMYKCQVGAFLNRGNCENLLKSLKEKGFNGYIKYE